MPLQALLPRGLMIFLDDGIVLQTLDFGPTSYEKAAVLLALSRALFDAWESFFFGFLLRHLSWSPVWLRRSRFELLLLPASPGRPCLLMGHYVVVLLLK